VEFSVGEEGEGDLPSSLTGGYTGRVVPGVMTAEVTENRSPRFFYIFST
jgi:hypothetical protein